MNIREFLDMVEREALKETEKENKSKVRQFLDAVEKSVSEDEE